ncbi:nuclear transport factor 2 family protein [Spirosoma pollinicola]|uniref:DUF4440 domain-containing protein n=1 Tax=Spirosoma pollinicola TaxID=2057025 RepID=A0A2K8Z705_9BACT|nr:nuclear transport factor 2 family protein [Spirosoma pollinicola]AUD05677.1 hypothetical protein CWM47_29845 [Spirosoma pollinicola]
MQVYLMTCVDMKYSLLIILLILYSELTSAQSTNLPTNVVSQLDSMEKAMFIASQNADAFGSLMGNDYITINADGVMANKTQTLEAVRTHPLPKADIVLSDNRQRVYGDLAIRTGRAKAYKAGLLLADFMYTETWIYRDGRWQFIGWQGTMAGVPSYYGVLITLVLTSIIAAVLWWFMKHRMKPRRHSLSQD